MGTRTRVARNAATQGRNTRRSGSAERSSCHHHRQVDPHTWGLGANMPRDDSWLRPDRRSHYYSSDTMPFRDWLRLTRKGDPVEEQLSDFLTRGTHAINDAAQHEMDAYLNGTGKKPRKKE